MNLFQNLIYYVLILNVSLSFTVEAVNPMVAQSEIELVSGFTRIESTCALIETGDVYCWGRNTKQELGYEEEGAFTARPHRRVDLSASAREITLSGRHEYCANLSNGDIECWGNDSGVRRLNLTSRQRVERGLTQIGEGRICYLDSQNRVRCVETRDSDPLTLVTSYFRTKFERIVNIAGFDQRICASGLPKPVCNKAGKCNSSALLVECISPDTQAFFWKASSGARIIRGNLGMGFTHPTDVNQFVYVRRPKNRNRTLATGYQYELTGGDPIAISRQNPRCVLLDSEVVNCWSDAYLRGLDDGSGNLIAPYKLNFDEVPKFILAGKEGRLFVVTESNKFKQFTINERNIPNSLNFNGAILGTYSVSVLNIISGTTAISWPRNVLVLPGFAPKDLSGNVSQ